jgi:hypothetical protein
VKLDFGMNELAKARVEKGRREWGAHDWDGKQKQKEQRKI